MTKLHNIVSLLTVFSVCLGVACQVQAKARFYDRTELVQNSSHIAVVSIGPVTNGKWTGKHWTYTQSASAQVVKTVKGTLPETIQLWGGEEFECAQTQLHSGRYLAFLIQEGQHYVGSNWANSLREIQQGDALMWFGDAKDGFKPKTTPLSVVLKQISSESKR